MKQLTVSRMLACMGVFFSIVSCNSELVKKDYSKVVRPPFEKVRVEKEVFKIDPTENVKVISKKGSIIKIPKNSLIDGKGKTVTTEVKLFFTEMHSLAEIIASGIPMTYEGEKGSGEFTSAGMFNIEAHSGETDVFVAQGNEIEVSLASFKNGKDFDFYALSEEGDWSYEGTNAPDRNINKFTRLKQLKKEIPSAPKKPFSADHFFEFNIDYSAFEELKAFDKLKWKFLAAKKGYKRGPWIYSEKWREVAITRSNEGDNVYAISLTSKKNKFECLAIPISKNKQRLAVDEFENLFAEYKQIKKDREDEIARVKNEANWLRSFKVDGFGIYNWDKVQRLIAQGDMGFNRIQAKVTWQSKKDKIDYKVFHLNGNSEIIQTNNQTFWQDFSYNMQSENVLLVVLPEDKIAISKSRDFMNNKLDDDKEIVLSVVDNKIDDVAELQSILNNL